MDKTVGEEAWEMWAKNWENAKRFFDSKGNTKTRSRLKDKWHKDFMSDLERFLDIKRKGGKDLGN